MSRKSGRNVFWQSEICLASTHGSQVAAAPSQSADFLQSLRCGRPLSFFSSLHVQQYSLPVVFVFYFSLCWVFLGINWIKINKLENKNSCCRVIGQEFNMESMEQLDLMDDIHSQNFNVIRLASYRTAVKFRFVQRRTHRKIYNPNLNINLLILIFN